MNNFVEYIWTFLQNNQFASGGILIAAVGSAIAYFRSIPQKTIGYLRRYFIVELTIEQLDTAYGWIEQWLALQEHFKEKSRNLTARSGFKSFDTASFDGRDPYFELIPSVGHHFFWYKNTPVWMVKSRVELKNENTGRKEMYFAFLSFRRNIVMDFMTEVRQIAIPDTDSRIPLYKTQGIDATWGEMSRREPRPASSVILKSDMMDDITADAKKFYESKQWYIARGIPHRRGHLYYGPPGTGKSSAALALASELKTGIAILSLSSIVNDDALLSAISSVPEKTLLLMEDIDCAFKAREDGKGLTFSGLLNAIDGVASSEGRLIVMTTNHPEKIDPALIRPGRVDRKYEIGYSDQDQAKRMFLRFFDNLELATRFAGQIGDNVTTAQIQAHLILNQDNVEEASVWQW